MAEFVANQVLNGLTAGAEYALVAAGLALIFGVLEIVNFAHGEFYMLGAYGLYLAQSRANFSYVWAAVTAVAGMAVFGVIFYVLVIHRILNRGWQIQLIATQAVGVILVNTATVLSGPVAKLVYSPLSGVILALDPVRISAQRIIVLGVTAIAFLLLYLMLKHTKLGKAMRAVAQNREAAVTVGIPLARVGLAAVVIGSCLAGVAAAAIAPLYVVQPTMGALVVVKAFAAVIMGGFGNVSGAVISAFILGMVEALGISVGLGDYSDVVVFGVMIAVLLVRPLGLFGREARVG